MVIAPFWRLINKQAIPKHQNLTSLTASQICSVLISVVRTVALSLVLSSTKISCSAFSLSEGDFGESIKVKNEMHPMATVTPPRIIIILLKRLNA